MYKTAAKHAARRKIGTIDARPAPGELFEQALVKFEEAHDAYVWRGSQPPETHATIEQIYKARRTALVDYAKALETGDD